MASTPIGLTLPAARSRPPELEDSLNRFLYHPLSLRLARLLRPTGISPNAVSVAGMVIFWGAAAAYVGLAWPESVVIGLTLHLLWHVVDGADGDLARMTGRTSATGELVDGVCDYAGYAVLYLALAAFLHAQIGAWAWPLAIAAAASHIAQTNHAESQRRFYLWWVYGVPWLKHAKAAGDAVFAHRNWFSLGFAWLARGYLWLVNRMTPFAAVIDRAIERAGSDRIQRDRIAELVRRGSGHALQLQKLLGPNPRTLLLGFSMAFATPLYFFLAEAVLLNLLLVWSVRHHNRVEQRVAEQIG